MTFKTIFTPVGLDHGNGDLELAARICASEDAHLTVCVVAPVEPLRPRSSGSIDGRAIRQECATDTGRLKARLSALESFLAERWVRAEIVGALPATPAADDVIGRCGRYSDLTFVGPEMRNCAALKEMIIDGALFHSAHPMLVAPSGVIPTLHPTRVMVIWKPCVEASRALREALDLLKNALEVHLVILDGESRRADDDEDLGEELAAFLLRHGVRVKIARPCSNYRPGFEIYRQYAREMNAEMIVTGGYGHSCLQHQILGSVTRSMIDEPPVPVLMAR